MSSSNVERSTLFCPPTSFEVSKTHTQNTRLLLNSFESVVRNYIDRSLWEKCEKAQHILLKGDSKNHFDLATSILQRLKNHEIAVIAEVYTTFFHLLNIAEEVEIVLVNRARSKDGERRGSISSSIYALAQSNEPATKIQEILNQLLIEPTFTAHPTEARRPSVVRKMHRIAQELLKGELADADEIHNLIVSLFATPEHRAQTPTVFDEVRYGIGLTASSLWEIVPRLIQDLTKALSKNFPRHQFEIPTILKFRSWIGGDRDGNAKVTASVTKQTIEYHRMEAITRQIDNLRDLYDSRALVLDCEKVPPSRNLVRSIDEDYKLLKLKKAAYPEDPALPHHAKLRLVFQKLKALSEGGLKHAQYTALHFSADLDLIKESLNKTALGRHISQSKSFRDALIRAQVFGFHLQTLDLRQHTEIHHRAVEAIRKCLPVKQRELPLEDVLLRTTPLKINTKLLTEEAKEALNVFTVAKEALQRDSRSIQCCIMSMTTSPDDFLKTLFLMKCTGLWRISRADKKGKILSVESDLDVVPLFETITDLTRASGILTRVFKSKAYQLQLKARNNHQEIMLGYSDSNKDGGYFMANLKLHIAMRQISKTLKKFGVTFNYFHGRGGTVARGGGRAHEAILATPEESRGYRIRMTEQGEVISTRYGVPEIAHRHLEQILNAMLLVHHEKSKIPPEVSRRALKVVQKIGKLSMKSYRDFVRAKDFWEDYTTVTPIHFLGRLKNASRAIFRNVSDTISKLNDLRAIPWVFSWIQTRLCLPGWFGIGYGLQRYLEGDKTQEKIEALQQAYKEWRFFGLIVDNARRELARTRLQIGERYLSLGKNSEPLLQKMKSDFESAESNILLISKSDALLVNEPKIAKLIEYRNRYTDLLNLAQVILLKRHQERKDDVTDAMLHVTSGLVAAMQSSG